MLKTKVPEASGTYFYADIHTSNSGEHPVQITTALSQVVLQSFYNELPVYSG